MTNFDKIAASAPINRQAASVTGRGEAWTPLVTLQDWYPDRPVIKLPDAAARASSSFVDFTGKKFGRITVLGMMEKDSNGPASWVCRCQCGAYCTRTSKSLRVASIGGNSFVDRCGRCQYQNKLATGWKHDEKHLPKLKRG